MALAIAPDPGRFADAVGFVAIDARAALVNDAIAVIVELVTASLSGVVRGRLLTLALGVVFGVFAHAFVLAQIATSAKFVDGTVTIVIFAITTRV